MKNLLLLLFLIPNLVLGGVIDSLISGFEGSQGFERLLYVPLIGAGFWIPVILFGNLIDKLKSSWGRMILWVLLIWGLMILVSFNLQSLPQNPIFYVLIILFVTAIYKYTSRDSEIDKFDSKPEAFFRANIIGVMFALIIYSLF